MSSGSGLAAVQASEYTVLTGDATLMALVRGVFDAVPENQPYPYIVLGESTEVPFRTFGLNGHEITRTHHIYDQDGAVFKGVAASGSARGYAVMNRMIQVLESALPTISGFAVVDYAYEFGQAMRTTDDAGATYRHIPVRFRCVLQDLA